MGDLDSNVTRVSLGPPQSSDGISIGSAIFVGLTSVTDRPTDRATESVTIDHIYERSTGDVVWLLPMVPVSPGPARN